MVIDQHNRNSQAAASLDHLLPAGVSGRGYGQYLLAAHRWCNSLRQHCRVTPELTRECRVYMIRAYRAELIQAGETYRSLTLALIECSPEARNAFLSFRGFATRTPQVEGATA